MQYHYAIHIFFDARDQAWVLEQQKPGFNVYAPMQD